MDEYQDNMNFIENATPFYDETFGSTRYHDYIGIVDNEKVFIHAETRQGNTTLHLINRDSVLFRVLTPSVTLESNSLYEFDYRGQVWRLGKHKQRKSSKIVGIYTGIKYPRTKPNNLLTPRQNHAIWYANLNGVILNFFFDGNKICRYNHNKL